jgi:transcriptional regulator with XRE-family HTH domain
MINNLGVYFREQRVQQGLTLGQLARMVGYQNLSKGANKIVRFEREGQVTEDLLAALADALHIDLPTVEELIEQDHQERLREWEAWVSQPVPMQLIARIIPAVYSAVPLPEEVTTPEQAEAFAIEYAKENKRQVCLVLSRRLSVWIDAEGKVYGRTEARPDGPNAPFMRLRGSGKKFLFRFGGLGRSRSDDRFQGGPSALAGKRKLRR